MRFQTLIDSVFVNTPIWIYWRWILFVCPNSERKKEMNRDWNWHIDYKILTENKTIFTYSIWICEMWMNERKVVFIQENMASVRNSFHSSLLSYFSNHNVSNFKVKTENRKNISHIFSKRLHNKNNRNGEKKLLSTVNAFQKLKLNQNQIDSHLTCFYKFIAIKAILNKRNVLFSWLLNDFGSPVFEVWGRNSPANLCEWHILNSQCWFMWTDPEINNPSEILGLFANMVSFSFARMSGIFAIVSHIVLQFIIQHWHIAFEVFLQSRNMILCFSNI